MANTKFVIEFDNEKLSAINQFSSKDMPSVEAQLQEQLEKIYTKTVPAPVRQYIDGKAKPVPPPKPKDKPKPDAPPNTSV